jgi:hypothetical protein
MCAQGLFDLVFKKFGFLVGRKSNADATGAARAGVTQATLPATG